MKDLPQKLKLGRNHGILIALFYVNFFFFIAKKRKEQ